MLPRLSASLLVVTAFAVALSSGEPKTDPRLRGSARGAKEGWVTVRLQGTPAEIGFQHGWLLANEIEDGLRAIRLGITHDSKDWTFFRTAAERVLWPKVDAEYRDELKAIVDGANARGVKVDLWDIVALNGNLELTYYADSLDAAKPGAKAERCSAFVATGSYTRDGKPVIGHNNWSGYLEGERWNIIFDIRPAKGHRILMDGYPGMIHSGDDFGLNSAGIAITETTITGFHGFDTAGVPEFVRARKAMQYAASIDDFARLMRESNNGGYANAWLVADMNTGEIGRLELGLKNVNLERTKDGYFSGANYPVNAKLAAEETRFNMNDAGLSPNARRVRWDQLMAEFKGKIDIAAGKRFLADHQDTFDKVNTPSERTLCGHNEVSPRGMMPWQPAFGPAGAVQSKLTDARQAKRMTMEAVLGHACGVPFKAEEHLKQYPQFKWMVPVLRDLAPHKWATFTASH